MEGGFFLLFQMAVQAPDDKRTRRVSRKRKQHCFRNRKVAWIGRYQDIHLKYFRAGMRFSEATKREAIAKHTKETSTNRTGESEKIDAVPSNKRL